MTKAEILRNQKEKEVELCNEFISFIKNEGFIETIDKVGSFAVKMPLFYKRVSETVFLAFNIPTYGDIKKYGFHADFWKINANSEENFLNSKLENKDLKDLRLSFNIERDLELYKNTLSKY